MKKILFTLAIFFTSFSFGQVLPKALRYMYAQSVPHKPDLNTILNCNIISQSVCNKLGNPGFVPSQAYYDDIFNNHIDPFNFDGAGNSLIPFWSIATGSPMVWDGQIIPNQHPEFPNPPLNTSGYLYCATRGSDSQNPIGYSPSESVVQKIPALTANNTYTLDFYKMYMNLSPVLPGVNYPVDRFRIVLMHCSDYFQTFWSTSQIEFFLPQVPVNSQTIYCENTVFNANWQRVFTKFTANQNYDMMWIYPETDISHPDYVSGILVSFPELIDVTSFTAGPTPTPTPPNCNVTIGPATPNCGPTGAVFTWTHGNATVVAPMSQQIPVDASIPANVGSWTLNMTLPNTVTTNSNGICGEQNFTISASVTVPTCMPPLPVGDWTWVHGDNTAYQYGVYGNLGVPSILNKSGARSSKIAWKDSQGDLWVFGGFGFASNSYGSLNDLWKYNINTGQWVWVSGDNIPNQYSTYGVQGVPSVNNKPAARGTAMNWKDNNGNFWIYGGGGVTPSTPSGFGYLNDQWKFNPNTNEWTWIRGNNSNGNNPYAVYGTIGVPSVNNHPGCRVGSGTWTDLSGNLWLFGGAGYPSSTSSFGALNDLWKYNPTTNEWTWVNGSNLINQAGSYGVKGVSSPSNMPSSRSWSLTWTDTQGNFYLFSGSAQYQSGPTQLLNDLWKYNPINNEWTWINGSNVTNQNGIFSSYGIPNANNSPGSRSNSNVFIDNNSNNVFLFSGWGYGSVGNQRNLQDLWKYNNSTNEWSCIKEYHTVYGGSIDYGAMGISSPSNRPGNREDAASWVDNLGRLWMFGGRSYTANVSGERNDLWKYTGNCTGANCLITKSNNLTNFINKPIQQAGASIFNKKEEYIAKPVLSNIRSLEIYNTAAQLLKKVNSDLESYEILRSNKVSGLIPGLYFIKVFYKDKTTKTTKQFLQ